MSLYQWRLEFSKKELSEHLKKIVPTLGTLQEIKIAQKDKAGIVQKIQIIGTGGTFSVDAKKLYAVIPKLFSCAFSISGNRSNVVILGHGYGHLIGLCQWGAYYKVLDGANYKNILSFYYPNTQLKRIV